MTLYHAYLFINHVYFHDVTFVGNACKMFKTKRPKKRIWTDIKKAMALKNKSHHKGKGKNACK